MASKLLTVTALFVSTAAAATPPVDTQRVTGNVSAEHQPKPTVTDAVSTPPIDTCRVTGNILTMTNKRGRALCRLDEHIRLSLSTVVVRDGEGCAAEGRLATKDGQMACEISTPFGVTHVPLADAAPVEPVPTTESGQDTPVTSSTGS